MGIPPNCNPCCLPLLSPPPSAISGPGSGSPESGSGSGGTCCPDGSGGQLVFPNSWLLTFAPNAITLGVFPMWETLSVWVTYGDWPPMGNFCGGPGWYGALTVFLPAQTVKIGPWTMTCDVTLALVGYWNCSCSGFGAWLWGGQACNTRPVGSLVYEATTPPANLIQPGWCPQAFNKFVLVEESAPAGAGGQMTLTPGP